MKVTGTNYIYFRGNVNKTPQQKNAPVQYNQQIRELNNVTPDFSVKVPQKFTKLSVNNLPNGLKLHNYKLANGYKVSIVPMEGSPAVVKTYVNVGSLNETADIKGISHFLEHMAFNGTNGENGHMKLETGDSFKKIDEIGGWANASTNYALTDFINSAPLLEKKDLETQIRILAAMSEDLKLSKAMIEKEKGPVSSEINMILDDPKTVALDQTIRTLYNIKNPADELVAGSVNHIQNLTQKDVVDYYNKYYTPDNTNIVITGDVNPEEAIRFVSKNFISTKTPKGERFEEKLTPTDKTIRKDFKTDKTKSAEIVLGFNGPENNNMKERILYTIAAAYLNSESIGLREKMKNLNASYGIGDEKITTNPDGNRLVYLGATASDENSEKVLKTIINTLGKVKPISENEMYRLKEMIKENRDYSFEHSTSVNNIIGNSVLEGTIDDSLNYDKILDDIQPEEIDSAVKKYFDINKAAITIVHPTQNKEISFLGRSRQPINEDKTSKITLNNNYDVAFVKTNSPRRSIMMSLKTDIPYNKKAGIREILDHIYTMGTKDIDENSFNKIKEELNLNLNCYAGASGINIDIDGNNKNYKQGLMLARELLYNPRINKSTLEKAKKDLKENLELCETTSESLYYNNFYSKYNPYYHSDKEKLQTIDSITIDDVREFHQYVLNNSRGMISANIPEENNEEIKNDIINMANSLNTVNKNIPQEKKLYKRLKKPVVITSAQNNSQADIKLSYNFKYNDSVKNLVIAELMNSILSNSSIGLFDVLREKEHLAYSVYSDICIGQSDSGEISLNILTTTDNKESGEKSYENLRKSIEGFHRQIDELKNGKFTKDDLENAKRSLKANLLNREGVLPKVGSLLSGMSSKLGINFENKMYEEINNITTDDIINFANNTFSGEPVYTITATSDTLNANRDFLEGLKD